MREISLLSERSEEIVCLVADRAFATLEARITHFKTRYDEIYVLLNSVRKELGDDYLPLLTKLVTLDAHVKGVALGVANLRASEKEPAPPPTPEKSDVPAFLPAVTLKKMKLPVYSGDPKSWREFHETFKIAVDEKPYHEIDKLNFLVDSLRGEARDAVRGYDKLATNYKPIMDMLKERFGCETKLVNVYYKELDDLPTALSSAMQRSNLDAIRKILANLASVGVSLEQDYLCSRIMRKFNRETLIAALTSLNAKTTEKLEVNKLIETLSNVVKIREAVDTYLRTNQPSVPSSSALISAPQAKTSAYHPRPGPSGYVPNTTISCSFCGQSHRSSACATFSSLSQRREVVHKKALCFFCLSSAHRSNTCRLKDIPCTFCGTVGHPKHMCVEFLNPNESANKRPRLQASASTPAGLGQSNPPNKKFKGRLFKRSSQPSGTFLETFITLIKTKNGNYIVARGVMDSCSAYSYISLDLIFTLGLRITKPSKLNVCFFGTTEPCSIESGEVRITICNQNKTTEKTLTFMATPCITGNIDTSPPVDSVLEVLPTHLRYADPQLFSETRTKIDIVIGNNYQFNVYTGEIKPINYGIILRQSMFGWIPTGAIEPDKNKFSTQTPATPALLSANSIASSTRNIPESHNTTYPLINYTQEENYKNLFNLENLWALENLGIKISELDEIDDFVLQSFRDTVRFENERYIVRWPWKQENPRLQSNFRMCMARLKSLVQRSSSELLTKYDDLLQDQLSLGIIEPAPKTTPFLTHYLPHRALLQKDKLRVVYDASAKTKSGHSLNDLLHKGPVLLEDLVGLLLNFRVNRVAITADIEKAFLQVGLNEVDRDVVRFIWLKDINLPATQENITIYRFARVPFGVISSPFLLNVVLQELLSTQPVNVWHTIVKNKFYVDNLLLSVKNTNEAVSVWHSATSKLKTASFNLRDWTSNDAAFLKAIGHPPLTTSSEKISILGLNWDRLPDNFTVKMQQIENPTSLVTKRIILTFYASIFDPLCFFGPCTLPLKLLLQKCWKNKYDWDTPLPAELHAQWGKIYNDCVTISNIAIPRLYWPFKEEGSIQLHIFCDASKNAYACCAYLVYTNSNTYNSSSTLAYSKVKVAPIPKKKEEEMTIPKLELLAVLIGTRCSIFIKKHFDLQFTRTIIWTDATTVLQWLNTSKLLTRFVQNRITEIKKTADVTFRYVPTESNPADIASRGSRAESLRSNDLWWHGPPWLCQEELWPATPETTQTFTSLPAMMLTGTPVYSGFLSDQLEKRFSTWNAYIRTFKHIYHFSHGHLGVTNPPSSFDEFKTAENFLISEIQKKYFQEEFAKLKKNEQPNSQLELYIEPEDGFIRCKGRMENAAFPWDTIHPILLPRNSPLTDIYIRDLHKNNFHLGCSHLLAKLRERFWVVKARSKINSIIHHCATCRRWKGGSYARPPMPPLPMTRVANASAFLHTGVDYTGHLTIKNDVGAPVKVYVVLFTCLVTRAVHLEYARDLSGAEFLMALIRFGSYRGSPKIMISDNATNFTFVQPLVGHKVTISDPKVDLYCNNNNIQWKFIPQYSPWHGGAYERLVAIVKKGLRKAYGSSYLDLTQLHTTLYQLADVINTRPLTYVSSNEVLLPLTPNHLIRFRQANAALPVEVTARSLPITTMDLIELYTETLDVIEGFWEAFRKLYLLSLRERHNALHRDPRGSVRFIPTPGDIVLVQEPSAPRSSWHFGIVRKINKRHSLAELRSKGKIISRSINLLYPLEYPVNANATDYPNLFKD